MFTKLFDLAYEVEGDKVDLEQDMGCGEVARVYLHAMHVRMIAAEMGILRGDPEAWQRVAILERRLRVLYERIAELDRRLWAVEKTEESECYFSDCTLELAREFCIDLAPAPQHRATPSNATTDHQPQGAPPAGAVIAQPALDLQVCRAGGQQ